MLSAGLSSVGFCKPGEETGIEHPFLKLLGYVLIGVGILLGVTAGLAVALGSDNPEWYI